MTLHFANTNFEKELMGDIRPESDQAILFLQFLPILYADENDGIGVTHAPYPSFSHPKWHLLDDPDWPYEKIESWAPSQQIAGWAQARNLKYTIPPWEIVKRVSSKAFAFSETPQLPGSALLYSWGELDAWIDSLSGPKVLKKCYGVAGKGHLFLPAHPNHLKKFAEKEFGANRPLIGQPWVDRKLDFSTQWYIHEREIEFLGTTLCINNRRGGYIGNTVGMGPPNKFLEEHKEHALGILKKMSLLGFFGNVGIDAMIWGDDLLHPIVEVNARKTMGWVALEFLKHHSTKRTITLSFGAQSEKDNLLPSGVVRSDGSVLHFPKNLIAN